jgi:mannosyltransferase OCH1-like enzyme
LEIFKALETKKKTRMNILQTYSSREMPDKLRQFSEKVQRLHPSWNYLFFSDEDIVRFFEEEVPHLQETFQGLDLKIQQLDFFRYAAIHHYGGLYLDLDMDMDLPFDEKDLSKCYFPQELERNGDPVLRKQGIDLLVGNYAFYAPKGHFFLQTLMDNIATQRISTVDIQEAQARRMDKSAVHVYYTTGPVMATQTYADVGQGHVQLLSPTPFAPSAFGKYGKHVMYGSWKRQALPPL